MNQQEFEKRVMGMLLLGEDPVLISLRRQYENSTIANRKFSGAGFFTHFNVKNDVPPLEKRNFEIGDVSVSLRNVKNAIGVILFVRDGYLSWLEGYTLMIDDWPDEYFDVVLEYIGKDGNRDYEALRRKMN